MLVESYKSHFKKTLLLAYPVMISQLGHVIVHITDVIFVGKIGTTALAACSLGISIFAIFMVFGIGISYGMTPLIAKDHGAKNYNHCGTVLINGFVINLCTGIFIFSLIYFCSPLLNHIKQDPEVVKQALPFLNIIGLSIIPLMIFMSFKQFAEGLSFTRQAMYITLTADALNVVMTYGLITGAFGLPQLGLKGAGWANFIARLLMALGMIIYVLNSKNFKPFLSRFRLRMFNVKECISIIRLGLPTALQYLFEIGAFSVAALFIGSIGANYQAAHQIAISIAALTYMAASGIGAAATVRVGNALGEQNYYQLRRAGISAYFITIGFMAFTGINFIVFNDILPTFYIKDQSVIEIAASLLIIAAVFQISDGVQVVGLGALRGMGDVRIPTMITLLAYWGFAIPLGWTLCFHFKLGISGIWYGLLTGLSTAAILLYIRFNYLTKKTLSD